MADATTYTRADVASRNGRNNSPLWIIYRDVVYDVTDYINEHPGGGEPIVECAGADSTRDFDDVGHSADAHTILSKYKIGELIEEDKHYDENGKKKKKKRVVAAQPEPEQEGGSRRSCVSVICCGLLG